MTGTARALGLAAILACGACGYESAAEILRPAPNDSCVACNSPDDTPITALEVGRPPATPDGGAPIGLGCGMLGGFEAVGENDPVPIVTGGQGANMIVLRLRVTGKFRQCAPERTRVLDQDGAVISQHRGPVALTVESDTVMVTRDLFFPGSYVYGAPITVIAEVAGRELTQHLTTTGGF